MSKKIKTAATFRTDYVIDNPNDEEVREVEYQTAFAEYDEHGNITKDISYNREGLTEKVINEYDDKQRLVSKTLYDEHDDILEKNTYSYNDEGLLVKEFIHYLDGSIDTTSCYYDKNGNLIKKETLDEEEELEDYYVYEYADGQLISERGYDYEDEIIAEKVMQYNGDQLAEMEEWAQEDFIRRKKRFEYDKTGRLFKTIYLNDKDQVTARETHVFNSNNRPVEIHTEDAYQKNVMYLTYNSQGKIINQEEYNQDDKLNHTVNRTFDEDGNLLKSAVYIDRHGEALNQQYAIHIKYTYWD